jgi:hypothetical protein
MHTRQPCVVFNNGPDFAPSDSGVERSKVSSGSARRARPNVRLGFRADVSLSPSLGVVAVLLPRVTSRRHASRFR